VTLLALDPPLEYRWVGTPAGELPVIVMLHHGLGSVSAWRDLPERVADRTALPVFVYSRAGYGQSGPRPSDGGTCAASWPTDFMHREALDVLPRVLAAADIERPLLLGQSDGASIAIIYAASTHLPRPLGLALLAPHVFVEDCTVASAAAARLEFDEGRLRARLARHHADPDGVFRGWNETWLSDAFRDWNIEAEVARVRCPMLVVQGLDDEYGTVEQIDRIKRRAEAPVDVVLLPDCGHSPQQDQPEATLAAVARLSAFSWARSRSTNP
jgi:pimeloyl-ACP methyl ester carboxylesterase